MNRPVPPAVYSAILDWFEDVDAANRFIAQSSPEEIFERYCEWHGLIGWSRQLWTIVTQLQESPK